jgi:hypothetical protein
VDPPGRGETLRKVGLGEEEGEGEGGSPGRGRLCEYRLEVGVAKKADR